MDDVDDEEEDDDEEDDDEDEEAEEEEDGLELILTAMLKLNGITLILVLVALFATLLKLFPVVCIDCSKVLFVELFNMFK